MLFLLVKSADQRDGVTSVMVEYVTGTMLIFNLVLVFY
jgi:hypothetical protein